MGSLNYDRHTAMNHDNRYNEIRNKAIWASPNRKWLVWITQIYYEEIREITVHGSNLELPSSVWVYTVTLQEVDCSRAV